jgi:hypothetical protein
MGKAGLVTNVFLDAGAERVAAGGTTSLAS